MSPVPLANITPDGTWYPGIGDPTIFGWIITAAYIGVFVLCIRAWIREDAAFLRGARGLKPRFWLILAALMLLLGLNKQLDLQTLVSIIGRRAAKSEGWYGNRREVQIAFIVLVALIAIAAVTWSAWAIRGSWKRYRIAAAGIAYLCFFIVLRAASFHHIDTILYKIPIIGLFVNRGLELGGIVLIGWCAFHAAAISPRTSPNQPRS